MDFKFVRYLFSTAFLEDVLLLRVGLSNVSPPALGPKCMKSTFLHILISQEEAWPTVWSSDEVVLGRGELYSPCLGS